jgi:hypothetical protein
LKDQNFLKKCLIYTALTPKNKCRSLSGSDGRFYRNELCFDGSDTLARKKLDELMAGDLKLDDEENILMKYWYDVLFEARKTEEYKAAMAREPQTRFGLWQIMAELNVKIPSGEIGRGGEPEMTYKYTALNTEIKKLADELKKYYADEILGDCFKYQLLK